MLGEEDEEPELRGREVERAPVAGHGGAGAGAGAVVAAVGAGSGSAPGCARQTT